MLPKFCTAASQCQGNRRQLVSNFTFPLYIGFDKLRDWKTTKNVRFEMSRMSKQRDSKINGLLNFFQSGDICVSCFPIFSSLESDFSLEKWALSKKKAATKEFGSFFISQWSLATGTLLYQINVPVWITEFCEKTLAKVLWLFLISENDFDWLTWFLALCTK